MVLNSKFRTPDSTSVSDYTISIGQSISIKQSVVQTVSLPNTVYNINDTNNVGFVNLIGLGTYVILVPKGQYNLAQFLLTLQGLLSAIDIGATVVQNPLTLKLDFTFSYPAQFSTLANSPLSKVIGTYINWTENPVAYPVAPVTSFSAYALPNLTGIRNIYICSRILGQGVNSILENGVNLPLVLNMPNSVPFGSVNYFQCNETLLNLKTYKQGQNTQYIDIQLRDIDGNIIDLNGEDWSLTMLVYYEISP
jgi:hypothetical protein